MRIGRGVVVSTQNTAFEELQSRQFSGAKMPLAHLKFSPDADIYECSLVPPTWDCVTWYVNAELTRRMAKCEGPLRIRFRTAKINDPQHEMKSAVRRQMLQHVVRPCLDLFGAVEDGSVRYGNGKQYSYRRLSELHTLGHEIPKVNIPRATVPRRLVITLREAAHGTWRNSRLPDYLEFAKRRQVDGWNIIFVRDTAKADEPIEGFPTDPVASRNVKHRCQLYASAECNILGSNGPANLLWFSDYPFINFIPMHRNLAQAPTFPEWWHVHANIRIPGKFPWMADDQHMVWEMDNLDGLERAWDVWSAHNHIDRLVAA